MAKKSSAKSNKKPAKAAKPVARAQRAAAKKPAKAAKPAARSQRAAAPASGTPGSQPKYQQAGAPWWKQFLPR